MVIDSKEGVNDKQCDIAYLENSKLDPEDKYSLIY